MIHPVPVAELEQRLGRARKPAGGRYIRFNCPFCTDPLHSEITKHTPDTHQCLFVSLQQRGRQGRAPGYGCVRCHARGGRRKLLALLGITGSLPPLTSDTDYDALRREIWSAGRKDAEPPPVARYGMPPTVPLYDGMEALQYLLDRGLKPAWIRRAGLQLGVGKYHDAEDPAKYTNVNQCIVIPDHPTDVSYWVARQYRPGFRGPKYKNPPGAQAGTLLFLRGAPTRRIVVVEGPLDAIVGGPDCVAVLGKEMSWAQIGALLKHAPEEVVVALDGEALDDQHALAQELSSWGLSVRTAKVPYGADAVSLGRRAFRRIVAEAEPWTNEEW